MLKEPYNQRLFSGGLRKWLHEGRFAWLHRETKNLSGSVLEVGCYDCRSLDYLAFTPTRYVGIDANWEGGLNLARQRHPDLQLIESSDPGAISGKFDCAISLETLEHVPRQQLLDYIEALAKAAPLALISVPVEIGPVFAVKQLVRPDNSYKYSLKEYICSTLGMTEHVKQDDHKGFNFVWFLKQLSNYYDIEKVSGIPFPLPAILSFGVGIRCRSRLFQG
jgi:hypothetical protein